MILFQKYNLNRIRLRSQQSPSSLSSGITVSANYKYIQPTSGCSGVCPVADYASKGLSSQVLEKEVSYISISATFVPVLLLYTLWFSRKML